MNLTSDKLCMLALLVIIILALFQIYNYMSSTEHMNPALLTHQVEDLAAKPGDPTNINFFVRGDRFAEDKQLNPQLQPILPAIEGIKCGPQIDWNNYASAGANNVYGDMIWNTTSPRMVLEDNSFKCGNQKFNAPVGIPEIRGGCDSQNLTEFGTVGAMSDQKFVNNAANLEKFINM